MTAENPRHPSGKNRHKVLAHRGFALNGAENTLPAFQAAHDLGCTWIETDVNTTSDGVVLAFHDSTLDRVTQGTGQVNDFRHQDLAGLRVAGESSVPTLREVLEALPTLQVNIDVKDEASVTALADLLAELDAADRVRIASFSDARRGRTLEALRARGLEPLSTSAGATGFVVAMLVLHTVPAAWPVVQRLLARWVPPFDAIQMPMYLGWILPKIRKVPKIGRRLGRLRLTTQRLVDAAHHHGIEVHVWTVNRPGDMQSLMDMGYDGLVTDRADVALAVVDGLWPRGSRNQRDPMNESPC